MLSSYSNMLSHAGPRPVPADRRWKPNVETAPNCPRCDSSNTKFCYYNNYSLSQPRYFCKGCRRYWTKGGSLRNVPVGGGCRKSRRGRATRNSGDPARDPAPVYSQHPAVGAPHARPDHGSDGAFRSGSSGPYPPADHPAHDAVDGSNIDLAALYVKYLNQCPQPGDAGIAEPVDSGGSSSASSCDRPPPQYDAPSGQHVDFVNQTPAGVDVDELLLAAMNQAHAVDGIDSASSLQDPCSFESSLAMFMEANCFPSDPCAINCAPSLLQRAAEYDQEFDSVTPTDCSMQQQLLQVPLHQSFVHDINGDQWSALDYSSLEGFYKL